MPFTTMLSVQHYNALSHLSIETSGINKDVYKAITVKTLYEHFGGQVYNSSPFLDCHSSFPLIQT
jgi:hypothetical protein